MLARLAVSAVKGVKPSFGNLKWGATTSHILVNPISLKFSANEPYLNIQGFATTSTGGPTVTYRRKVSIAPSLKGVKFIETDAFKNMEFLDFKEYQLAGMIEKNGTLSHHLQEKFFSTIPDLIGPEMNMEDLYRLITAPYIAERERGTLKIAIEALCSPTMVEMCSAGIDRISVNTLVNYRAHDLQKLVDADHSMLFDFINLRAFWDKQLLGDRNRIASFVALIPHLESPEILEDMNHRQLNMLLSKQMRVFLDTKGVDVQAQINMGITCDPQFWNKLYRRMYKALPTRAFEEGFVHISEDKHRDLVDRECTLLHKHPHDEFKEYPFVEKINEEPVKSISR